MWTISSNKVCTRNSSLTLCNFIFSGESTCQGDSGGPLVIRSSVDEPWYQIGVVSFGLQSICGARNNLDKFPGIFTKIVHYLPWVNSKMKD